MTKQMAEDSTLSAGFNRRRMLRTGGVLAGAATLLGVPSAVRSAQADTLTLDVACDGGTMRTNRIAQGDTIGAPMPGDTFLVTGTIFPEGAFDNGVANPDDPGAIGRWTCQGTILVDIASGALPHAITTVLFTFGDALTAREGQVDAAADGLVSTGVEGGVAEVSRTISGGYGRYAGARGEVIQTTVGLNETMIEVAPGMAVPAPNYRFTFRLAE